MDSENLVMQCEDLTNDELDYELLIRYISSSGSRREMSSSLRRQLKLEHEGKEDPPVLDEAVVDPKVELGICEEKIVELNTLLDAAYTAKDRHAFNIATSRLLHLFSRLERLGVVYPNQKKIQEAKDCVEKTINNIKKSTAQQSLARFTPLSSMNVFNIQDSPGKADRSLLGASKSPPVNKTLVPTPKSAKSQYEELSAKVDRLTESFEKFLKSPSKVSSEQLIEVEEARNLLEESNPFLSVQQNAFNNSAVPANKNVLIPSSVPIQTNRELFSNQNKPNLNSWSPVVPNQPTFGRNNPVPRPNLNHNQQQEFPSNCHRWYNQNNFEEQRRLHYETRVNYQPQPRMNTNPNQNMNQNMRMYQNRDQFNPGYQGYQNEYQNHNMRPNEMNFQARSYKKTIPINQWNLKFSGEEGLSLTEFLGEVDLYAQSEGFTPHDLFNSAIHLFTGHARKWYKAHFQEFRGWNELVLALKEDFQPQYYDYMLLTEIESRMQGKSETFSTFLAEMVILFGKLGTQISEDHKLYILRKNMQSCYSYALATQDIYSVRQLHGVCKRIDTAKLLQERNNHPDSYRFLEPSFRAPIENKKFFRNTVNVIEDEDNSQDEECEAFDNFNRKRNFIRKERSTPFRSGKCFNCDLMGHGFRSCPQPRKGLFCYECGLPNVTVENCTNCKFVDLKGQTEA